MPSGKAYLRFAFRKWMMAGITQVSSESRVSEPPTRRRVIRQGAAGGRAIRAVALVAGQGRPATPCGGCRQKLREFAGDAVPVHCRSADGAVLDTTMGALLPLSFGPEALA